MICTEETVKLLDEATHIANMIIDSDIVQSYLIYFDELSKNEEAQKRIKQFVEVKEKYEEVKKYGKYHPDYKDVMKSFWEVKRKMDLTEEVANFKRSENELQLLLDEISFFIGRSVSEHIKVATGNPFYEQASTCKCNSTCNC